MDLKKLFTEDRAVSPVIGVILMVAITVILAAVIGAFVLGIGGETESTPQASLSFELNEVAEGFNTTDVEHRGGSTLDTEDIRVVLDGDNQADVEFDSESLSSGETVTIDEFTEDPQAGSRIVLIHEPSDGTIASGRL